MFPPPHITFRPLISNDLPVLRDWLSRPHVAEWDHPTTLVEVEEEYAPLIAGSGPDRAGPAWRSLMLGFMPVLNPTTASMPW